jgi:hypothetical protein
MICSTFCDENEHLDSFHIYINMILIGIFFFIEFILSFDLDVPYTINEILSTLISSHLKLNLLNFSIILLNDNFWTYAYQLIVFFGYFQPI